MRTLMIATAIAAFAVPALASAQTVAPAPASAAKYSSSETNIGTLIDDPAAKAILDKHIPSITTNAQIDMARGMTLKMIQQYAPGDVTDAKLAAIDADLAQLPAK